MALAALAAALTGCGSPSRPTPLHAAPEPALAPPVAAAPAGRVLALPGGAAGHAEGIVVDAADGLVAVALRDPARIAILSAATGAVLRTVPVAGSARHLMLAGSTLLVPAETANSLSFLDLLTGQILGVVPTGRQPHDVAVVGDTDVVADEFSSAVTVITRGRVVATIKGPLQPGGATSVGDIAVVVDVRGRLLYLYKVAGGTATQVATLPAGAGPTHDVAVGGGRVVVADTDGGALLLDQITGHPHQISATPRPGRPYGIDYDPVDDELWVTATADNLLVAYKVTATGLEQVASYPTVRDAYSVAVDDSSGVVFVAGQYASQLQVITP